MENNNINNIIDPYNLGTDERVDKLKKVLQNRQKSITVVLENIADKHNLSACLRSCDAVGILDVCLIYHNGQVIPSLSSVSSSSASKWLGIRNFFSVEGCYNQLRSEGKKIFTTQLASDSVSLYELDLTQPIALVFGNEHSGVTDEATKKGDGNFLIPQIGIIQSLNISVSCAVSVYEAFRQRQVKGLHTKSELSEQEINTKLIEWLKK
jgi:tRNA (guanosine-2'-O-)-methyltransferase